MGHSNSIARKRAAIEVEKKRDDPVRAPPRGQFPPKPPKEGKEREHVPKAPKESKEHEKPKEAKELPEKPQKDKPEKETREGLGATAPVDVSMPRRPTGARRHFIEKDLRPDLTRGALLDEPDLDKPSLR